MHVAKGLEDHIMEIFQNLGNQKLRWSQIRNMLLTNEDIPSDVKNSEGFSVKLSRSLKLLCKEGILQKHEGGHRNVSYSLAEDAREKLLKKHGSIVNAGYLFVGIYKPGCSLKEFKRSSMKQWIEHFEEFLWPQLRRSYEEAEKHFRKRS